jgi:hypothetical protein
MNSPYDDAPAPANARTHAAVREIKALIRRADRECGCSAVVGDLLKSLAVDEQAPVVRELFGAAVRQRTKVIALSELLQELDDLSASPDQGELDEAAMLFEDMADQARLGSQYLRALSAHWSDSRCTHPTAFPAGEPAR